MLSKCANPDCNTTLHYLREGKVFKIESEAEVTSSSVKPIRQVEHFWLCGNCSASLTLTYAKDVGVQVIRKPVALTPPHARRAIA